VKLKGAQIFIKALLDEGVDTIFGYPGGVVLDIYDELHKGEIRHILVRHEQGAAHAADGYARASGKVGVCLVTSGPGATNTVTGIATAYMDSIPIVVFTGQVSTALIGSDAFQEADITGITRPCTKHNFIVRRTEDLVRTIKEAFYIARAGRPGPVLVDLPKDVAQGMAEYAPPEAALPRTKGPSYLPDVQALEKVLCKLREAKRPVMLIGGGVILGRASEELRAFVRKTGLPVTSTLMGMGAYPGVDPLWLGMLGMHGTYYANMAVSHADLLVAVGVRFDDRVTGRLADFAKGAKIVHIDIDPASINKNVTVDLAIVSDSRTALQQLNRMLDQDKAFSGDRYREWHERIGEWKAYAPLSYCLGEQIKPQCVIETLYRLTDGDAIVATEVGQNQMWTAQFYPFKRPNQFLTSGGLGTMGYGFPAAIGAQFACPDRTVVDIAGDGSIQMNIQELATAVNYNVPVKVVILNNGFLGMVRQWQEIFYGRRYSNTNISRVPDFVKLAEAYGATGLRATRPEEMEAVLKKGLETPGPVFMDIVVDSEEGVYPMVGPGAALTEMDLGRKK
jgi:acetolactate synthase-1/2/3 large subunit